MPALEMSRYCVPWTPFKKQLTDATVMLVSTAAVYAPPDAPFNVDGDLTWRRIPGSATAAELAIADAHYDHGCVDGDLNCVFPLDRLRELAREGRIAGVAEAHFSTGFTQALRDFKEKTVPDLVGEASKLRPDIVVLTGG